MVHSFWGKIPLLNGLWIILLKTIVVYGLVTSRHSSTWLRQASQSRLMLSKSPPVNIARPEIGERLAALVVSTNSCTAVDFLNQFALQNKMILQSALVGSLNMANSNRNAISVIDASSITANDVHTLKQVNAIYLMDGNIKESTDESLLATAEIVRQSCKFDLYILPTADKDVSVEPKTLLISAGNRLKNLIERIRSPGPSVADTLLDAGEWSHFVSLTFPSIDAALPALPSLRIGADAFELRVDLLEDKSVLSLHRQIALLRDTCTLPIVFTVRSVGQIGKFPPDPKKIFALLEEGLRAGAEWIDVEACWPSDQISAFTALAKERYSSTSRLLGSLHITTPQSREQVDQMYVDCSLGGCADVLKVVTGAANNADCEVIHTSGSAINGGKPYIGLCLGPAGARSRILNRRFTPVTHALMAVAAPGQLTVDQLMDARQSEGLCVPKQYFLFGTPIQQSLSPAMHNGAYAALRLPHSYGLREESAATDYIGLLQEASFGGASVTIPHKETIIPLIDEVRGAAVSIGAVNTIVTEMSVGADGGAVRRLVGYNTDWLGIKRPLLRQLLARGGQWSNDENSSSGNEKRLVGLVIGAGGTAKAASYAVNDLGLDLLVYNRTPEKANELAAAVYRSDRVSTSITTANRFGGRAISTEELESLDPSTLQVVISTLPAHAGFTLPTHLLETPNPPVIFDVVYKPAMTKLIAQAMEYNCLFVQGATMLLEQGMEQFELWNKRRAPRVEMDAAVFNGVERLA